MTEAKKLVQDTEWRGMAFIFVLSWVLTLIVLLVKAVHAL